MPFQADPGSSFRNWGRYVAAILIIATASAPRAKKAQEQAEATNGQLQIEIAKRERAGEEIRKLNEGLEARVRERTAQLESTNAGLEQFAYVASHDLQKPMRMFTNLIGNAINFRKDRAPLVRVAATHEAGWWRFTVSDNGIGIASEFREQLFDIFKRLHTRRAYPGSGIGLAICKRIIERHGGGIGIESAPDGGAVFWFTLPEERSI